MASTIQYDTIVKYQVHATCTQPLHIGSAEGDQAEVLVHPVDEIPFIQATSISGVFREYYTGINGKEEAELLFGRQKSSEEETDWGSRIRFSDGNFVANQVKIELRPRVKVNSVTGTCDSSKVEGSGQQSGQKFDMKYIGAGAKLKFSVYLYGAEGQEKLEDVFAALHHQQLQLGGQKSNGCGYLQIDKLLCKEFDMKKKEDRVLWMQEEELEEKNYTDRLALILSQKKQRNAYEILIAGKTEGELLIKSIAVTEYGKGAPDCMNIQNAKKDYIIPGSSFKGCIRSQMEKIAGYLDDSEIIYDSFGINEKKGQKGKAGNMRFFDTIVGNQEDNDKNALSHRIHIDKFTGGVMHGGLFNEKNIFGDVNMRVDILKNNNPEKTCGLLLMALRDLAVGMVSLGGGYNVGKGFIQVEDVKITAQDGSVATISFAKNEIQDEKGIIKKCLTTVRRG